MAEQSEKLHEVAEKLLIGEYHRHVFLCTGDKCCTTEVGQEAWEALKKELKDDDQFADTFLRHPER